MGVSTSIVANHKVITPPVSLADINSVFGMNYTDLGEACTSRYINRWARYKPVIKNLIDTTGQLNSNNTWKTGTGGATWWNATAQNCGLNVTVPSGTLTNLISTWMTNGWQEFWKYVPPTGGSASPYRLTDFNYYCHTHSTLGEDADKPYTSWLIGGAGTSNEVTLYADEEAAALDYLNGMSSGVPHIYLNRSLEYRLTLDDIRVASGAASAALSTTYFGVIIVKGYGTANVEYSIVTSPYRWNENVPSTNEYDHPAGYDIRRTPQLMNKAFDGNGAANGTRLVFPVMSTFNYSDQSNSVCTMGGFAGSTTFSGDFKVYPLMFDPIEVTLTRVARLFTVALTSPSISVSGSQGTFTATAVIKNVSDTARSINLSDVRYEYYVYPVEYNSSGQAAGWDYQGGSRFPSSGYYSLGSTTSNIASGATESVPISVSFNTSTPGYAMVMMNLSSSLGTVDASAGSQSAQYPSSL